MIYPLEGTAVLFIDIINPFNFDGGHKLIKHTKDILPNLIHLKQFAKKNKLPIIYINDHYGLWQADFKKIIEHCKNGNSKEIIDALKPDEQDYFLIKPMHSAFFQTPLQSLLTRSEEHTSELQSRFDLVCRLLLEKKNKINNTITNL